MIEPIYTTDCWQGYINYIRDTLQRTITQSEYKVIMDAYIHKKDITHLIEDLK